MTRNSSCISVGESLMPLGWEHLLQDLRKAISHVSRYQIAGWRHLVEDLGRVRSSARAWDPVSTEHSHRIADDAATGQHGALVKQRDVGVKADAEQGAALTEQRAESSRLKIDAGRMRAALAELTNQYEIVTRRLSDARRQLREILAQQQLVEGQLAECSVKEIQPKMISADPIDWSRSPIGRYARERGRRVAVI